MNIDTNGFNTESSDTKSCYIICIEFVLMRCITSTYIHCETNLHKENMITMQQFTTHLGLASYTFIYAICITTVPYFSVKS